MPVTEVELISRAEITDTLVRYCQAQDQNDWSLYEGVFDEDARIEFGGMPMPTMSATALRGMLVEFNKTRISGQHMISNILFAIEGGRARTISEVMYITLHPTETANRVSRVRGNALYVDDLVRHPDGWRIRHRVIAYKNVERDETDYDPALLDGIRAVAATDWINPKARRRRTIA